MNPITSLRDEPRYQHLKLLQIEWFVENRRGAELFGSFARPLLARGGHEDGGDPRCEPLNDHQHLEAIHSGHVHVRDDHIWE